MTQDDDLIKRAVSAPLLTRLSGMDSFDILKELLNDEAQLVQIDVISAFIINCGE